MSEHHLCGIIVTSPFVSWLAQMLRCVIDVLLEMTPFTEYREVMGENHVLDLIVAQTAQ